jgi:hypothetical protein
MQSGPPGTIGVAIGGFLADDIDCTDARMYGYTYFLGCRFSGFSDFTRAAVEGLNMEGPQEAERQKAANLWHDEGWIFADELGRKLNARTDQFHWKRLLADAGVRDARLHGVRHTAATFSLNWGSTTAPRWALWAGRAPTWPTGTSTSRTRARDCGPSRRPPVGARRGS